ncbi:hypothetical protein B1806_10015 [Metallibacterium scheffleri]|uniref:Uncharacterized protein n=1 Tax=Metallibacterium scheffleri TaxID=993689 RepID=A0A4S3KLS5_9GAMM|nr:hypothetical protein B1806_10015 [Metallibacterium scheffleri]
MRQITFVSLSARLEDSALLDRQCSNCQNLLHMRNLHSGTGRKIQGLRVTCDMRFAWLDSQLSGMDLRLSTEIFGSFICVMQPGG